MKAIEVRYTNTGCPWAGGAPAEIAIADVQAIGRLTVFGDNVDRCFVRVQSGAIYFVKISAQKKPESTWLARQFRNVPAGLAPRFSFRFAWTEIHN